jgi:hypothetical protein
MRTAGMIAAADFGAGPHIELWALYEQEAEKRLKRD